jgi:hypothetical protein
VADGRIGGIAELEANPTGVEHRHSLALTQQRPRDSAPAVHDADDLHVESNLPIEGDIGWKGPGPYVLSKIGPAAAQLGIIGKMFDGMAHPCHERLRYATTGGTSYVVYNFLQVARGRR